MDRNSTSYENSKKTKPSPSQDYSVATTENSKRSTVLYKNHIILVAGGKKKKTELEKTLEQTELFLNFRES